MAQAFEDFLIDIADRNDRSVLDRLEGYLHQHVSLYGQASMIELRRIASEFQIKAPNTLLARDMGDQLRAMAYCN